MAAASSARRLSPEARRSQLLDVAGECVAEQGIAHFTLALVAQRAGVSGPLVRHYFGDRDGLLIAVCQRLLDEVLASLLAGPQAGGLRDRLTAYLEHLAAHPWGHAVWMHAEHLHPELGARTRQARDQLAAFSFDLDWTQATAQQRARALGWVGYVESVVADWLQREVNEVAEPLAALMDAADQLGVPDLSERLPAA